MIVKHANGGHKLAGTRKLWSFSYPNTNSNLHIRMLLSMDIQYSLPPLIQMTLASAISSIEILFVSEMWLGHQKNRRTLTKPIS